jgi:DNA-binding transcriptional LysR family regulator
MNQVPESSYITRTLANTATVLCAAPDYLARHGVPATPEDLTMHNCLIVTNAPLGPPWAFTGPSGAAHAVKVNGNLRTNSAAAQLEAALRGQGIALQPDFMVEQALREGRMTRLLPDYATERITFRMVYPPGRHLTAKLRAFADFLVAHLSS